MQKNRLLTAFITTIIFFISNQFSFAQVEPVNYSIGLTSAFSTNGNLPFWFYTDRFGIIDPQSANLLTDINVYSDFKKNSKWGYGYGAELVGRLAENKAVFLNQLYFKAHYGHLTIHIGRMKERLNDHMPSLSSGSMMWSGNAAPMPKIAVYFPDYAPIPFTYGYLEIKGYWSQGFFGNSRYVKHAYLQQKQLYVRAGGKLPIHGFFGLTDDVQWGGTSSNPKVGRLPQDFRNYIRVTFGEHGGPHSPKGEEINALGNHIGSWELGVQLDLPHYKGIIYRQSIFEDKSGLRLGQGSIKDGILGVGIQSKNPHQIVSGILWQFLYSKNQSGPALPDPPNPLPPGATKTHDAAGHPWGGRDNYFNNYIYRSGWTYFGRTIGTPFLTTGSWESIMNGTGAIINNRVLAQHIGVGGMYGTLSYKAFFTYTKNYGTYGKPFTPPRKQYSVYYQLNIPVQSIPQLTVNGAVSADFGDMYGRNLGLMIGINYSGIMNL